MGNYIPDDRLMRIEDKIDRLMERIDTLRVNAVTWRQVWGISGGLSVIVSAIIEVLRGWKT